MGNTTSYCGGQQLPDQRDTNIGGIRPDSAASNTSTPTNRKFIVRKSELQKLQDQQQESFKTQ